MNTQLDSLDPRFKPKALELLARFVEAKIPVLIVNTRRTAAEQDQARQAGHSWVTHSKHEDGLAIDVVPYSVYTLHGTNKLQWDASDPIWEVMAQIAERLGLTAGYRWHVKDCGHYELSA